MLSMSCLVNNKAILMFDLDWPWGRHYGPQPPIAPKRCEIDPYLLRDTNRLLTTRIRNPAWHLTVEVKSRSWFDLISSYKQINSCSVWPKCTFSFDLEWPWRMNLISQKLVGFFLCSLAAIDLSLSDKNEFSFNVALNRPWNLWFYGICESYFVNRKAQKSNNTGQEKPKGTGETY
jgi:hypothetical protein